MRQPKLSNLRIDPVATKKIRADMAKARSVKITINVDADSLLVLKEIAKDTGVPLPAAPQQALEGRAQEAGYHRVSTRSIRAGAEEDEKATRSIKEN